MTTSPMEAPRPEVLSSAEVYETLKALDGSELVGGITWKIGRRGAKNPDKGLSTSTDNGVFATFAPGTEHPGYERDKLVDLSAKSLITLMRHALRPELGETQASKSEDYKQRQTDLSSLVAKVAQKTREVDDAEEVDDATLTELERLQSGLCESFQFFVYGTDVLTEEQDEASSEACVNLVALVSQVQAPNQGTA